MRWHRPQQHSVSTCLILSPRTAPPLPRLAPPSLAPSGFAVSIIVIKGKTWTFQKTHGSEIDAIKNGNSFYDFSH